jgi:hypothetical protein
MEQRLGHTDVKVKRAFPRPINLKGNNVVALERRASMPVQHTVPQAETRRSSYTERSMSSTWLVKPIIAGQVKPDVATAVKAQHQMHQQQEQKLKQQEQQQAGSAATAEAAVMSREPTLKRTQSRADLESKLTAANEALLQLRRRVDSLAEGPEKDACIKAVDALQQISALQPPKSPPRPSRRTSAIIMKAVVTVQQPLKQHLADHYCTRSTTEDSILVH